jgi:hypothetical protein
MAIETADRLVRNSSVLLGVFTPTTAPTRPALRALMGVGTTLLSTAASTGNGSVTVQYDVDDKIAFRVAWLATAASTGVCRLTVTQGTARRAWQRDIGSFTLTMPAAGSTGRVYMVGPFETARFAVRSTSTVQAPVGRNYVRFTGTTGSTSPQARRWNIQAFRMPDVRYAT